MRSSRFVPVLTCLLAVISPLALTPPRVLAQTSAPEARTSSAYQHGLATVHPRSAGIDEEALRRLIRRAEETHTDALVVLKDGRLVAEYYSGAERGPIEAMSATKSVVNLAVGFLLDEGKITSLDQRVHDFYPEWRQGLKEKITIRHLLNHTSGLEAGRITRKIYDSPDFVQFALAADVVSEPGTRFFYNNKAVNLLAGIVQKASGQRMDCYLDEKLFRPLGVTDYTWDLDDAGNPHALAGLDIHAADFAKIGYLVATGGVWEGKRIISEDWLRASFTAAPVSSAAIPILYSAPSGPDVISGLLWWLIPESNVYALTDSILSQWRAEGVRPEFIERIQLIGNRPMEVVQFRGELRNLFGEDYRRVVRDALFDAHPHLPLAEPQTEGPVRAVMAIGYLGQMLLILPEENLVAVRQIRTSSHESPEDGFSEFAQMVRTLVR